MRVDVDEPGGDDEALGVDLALAGPGRCGRRRRSCRPGRPRRRRPTGCRCRPRAGRCGGRGHRAGRRRGRGRRGERARGKVVACSCLNLEAIPSEPRTERRRRVAQPARRRRGVSGAGTDAHERLLAGPSRRAAYSAPLRSGCASAPFRSVRGSDWRSPRYLGIFVIHSRISSTPSLVHHVRRDVRHPAQAEPRHPVVDQRPLRVARHEQPRVLQLEVALARLHVDDARLLERQGERAAGTRRCRRPTCGGSGCSWRAGTTAPARPGPASSSW